MSESSRPGAPAQALSGGELNAAITSALVRIHHAYLGRGPTTATTFHHENVVVTLMYGVLTLAEQSLTRSGHSEGVASIRQAFQGVMESEFTEAVERLSGRSVIGFVSGNNVQSGVSSEVFILDGNP